MGEEGPGPGVGLGLGLKKKESFGCGSSTSSSIISDMAAQHGGFIDCVISDTASDTVSDTNTSEEFLPRPSLGCYKSQGNESRCLLSFKAHAGGICTMAMSQLVLYTGSEDGLLCAFRLADLKEMARFGPSNNGSVKAILLAGPQLISAHQDHKIRVWSSSSSHKLQASLPSVRDFVSNAVLQRNNYLKIRRHRKCPWNQHFDTISCMALDDQAGVFYSGSWDRTLKVWRIRDYKCLESVDAHTDAINAVAVSKRGVLFSGSADSTVKVWVWRRASRSSSPSSTSARKDIHLSAVDILQQPAPVNCLALWGNWVYSGCSDGRISAWMVAVDESGETSEECRVYQEAYGPLVGHSMSVLSVAAAGDVVCSGSADRSVRVWRRGEEGETGLMRHWCICVLQEMHCRSPVKSVLVSVEILDGCIVYSGGLDGFVKVWWVSLGGKARVMESPCSVLDYYR